MQSSSLVPVLILLAVLSNRGRACVTCDRRLWSKFQAMMDRCLVAANEQECSSRLSPLVTYTRNFKMVYTETMIYSFLELMDLIYPFMFTLDYEPLDMSHAFIQKKLKEAVCEDDCSNDFPVPVLFCSNCSVIPVPCHWPHICGGGRRRKARGLAARSRRVPRLQSNTRSDLVGFESLEAQRWKIAEMIIIPTIAVLFIGMISILIIILLWIKQVRLYAATCNQGYRYLKDETVTPTH